MISAWWKLLYIDRRAMDACLEVAQHENSGIATQSGTSHVALVHPSRLMPCKLTCQAPCCRYNHGSSCARCALNHQPSTMRRKLGELQTGLSQNPRSARSLCNMVKVGASKAMSDFIKRDIHEDCGLLKVMFQIFSAASLSLSPKDLSCAS